MMDLSESIEDSAKPPSSSGKKRMALSIFRYFPYGGLQRDMMALAKELISRGVEVTVFCMIWDAPEPEEGICVRKIAPHGWSNHGKARNFDRDLKEIFHREKFFAHCAFNCIGGADWFFAGDRPFARRVASTGWWRRMFGRYRTFFELEKSVFSRHSATRIMCVTEEQRRDFQHYYATPDERIETLPPGIFRQFQHIAGERESRRAKARGEFGVTEEQCLLIQISSAFYTKGVDRSIAALAALPEEERERTVLLIVGQSKEAHFRKLAKRFGVDERVIFTGGRDDVPDLLCGADLMIHPARNEASGTVLLESLVCGTPVLCSAACGFAPLVIDAGSVVLPAPFRQKQLNRMLMLTLSAPGRLEELQRNAMAYAARGNFVQRSQVMADFILGEK